MPVATHYQAARCGRSWAGLCHPVEAPTKPARVAQFVCELGLWHILVMLPQAHQARKEVGDLKVELIVLRGDVCGMDLVCSSRLKERCWSDNTLQIFICGWIDKGGAKFVVDKPVRLL